MNIFLAAQHLVDLSPLPHAKTDYSNIQIAFNVAFSIIGAIAVMIIVLSGMRYVFARDNPENISKARNSVIYAVIGLVIVASAAAIVNLIISKLGK